MTRLEALMAIAERNDGKITPASVIEAARAEDSVLHGSFTWDDTEAARKWRVQEAQDLIRECRIRFESDGETVVTYAFVGLSTDRTGDAATNPYRRASDVAASEDLTAVAVRDALSQLRSLKSRYQHLTRLASVWSAIDAIAD